MVSPWIGALGAFIAGSNTVSNMMFSYFQWSTAMEVWHNVDVAAQVVAAQAIGGAAGNMISVHNVVAACAVVGMMDKEGAVIQKTLVAMVYYVVQGGLISMAMVVSPVWWVGAIIWPVAFLGFWQKALANIVLINHAKSILDNGRKRLKCLW